MKRGTRRGGLMNPLKRGKFETCFHRPDEISATENSPRWNGIKRFHWAGWAGRDAEHAEDLFILFSAIFAARATCRVVARRAKTETAVYFYSPTRIA